MVEKAIAYTLPLAIASQLAKYYGIAYTLPLAIASQLAGCIGVAHRRYRILQVIAFNCEIFM
ncbi:hypothetical protein [Aulosira sp. FACHB-615]|uniref:hypothetical protein n=1 Tax=Aulosira sp. FACHB-615 TaxID=2692777 RepID=UPI001687DF1B|nr:hypothetical protein [Aulosira sp. FACHB-615]MBD2492424.1 hypothetical protein [Aulosira sp. FACHB-615]